MLPQTPIRLALGLCAMLTFPYPGMTTDFSVDREFSPGKWVEEVTCRADPEQRYALYLPTAYDPETTWPTLIVMDARGRALDAAKRFEAAAETYGWVIASSYGTESDSGWEPNQRALAAMLPDLESRVALDHERQVFAGFSGTARIAWALAQRAPGMVDGVIAASGGTEDSRPPERAVPFPVFLTAGERDFNLPELRRIAEGLEATDSAFRFEVFDGRHEWMPEELAGEALAWMELQAIRRKLRPADEALVSELLQARLESARRLRDDGRLLRALAGYRSAVRDFDGLVPKENLSPVRDIVRELDKSPETKRARTEAIRIADQEAAYQRRVEQAVSRIQKDTPPPPADKLASELDVSKLLEEAEDDSQPARAAAASRKLSLLHTHMSFYLPRQMLRADEPWRALTAAEIAHRVYDGLPRTWLDRARALTRLDRPKDAVEVLAEGLERGFLEAEDLATVPDFDALREREDFRALLDS